MFQSMPPEQQAQVQAQAQSFARGQGAATAGGALQAQQALKNEGNRLHAAGQYGAAAEKYEEAIRSAQGGPAAPAAAALCPQPVPSSPCHNTPKVSVTLPCAAHGGAADLRPAAGDASPEAAALVKACKLNLSSCHLNQGRHRACIAVCGEILALEPGNRKALYRRGQAHLAQQDAAPAVRDLRATLAASPPDEHQTVQEKLDAALRLAQQRGVDTQAQDEDDVEEIMCAAAAAAWCFCSRVRCGMGRAEGLRGGSTGHRSSHQTTLG